MPGGSAPRRHDSNSPSPTRGRAGTWIRFESATGYHHYLILSALFALCALDDRRAAVDPTAGNDELRKLLGVGRSTWVGLSACFSRRWHGRPVASGRRHPPG